MAITLKRIVQVLNAPLHPPDKHRLMHSTDHFAHMAYSGLVFVEAHHFYAYAAGVMFVVAVLSLFIHEV